MDHKKVLEYTYSDDETDRKVKIREIANSFIESKDAVQKVAIIDVADEFKWDILAKERGKAEGITEYFKNFLDAQEQDTPSRLTLRAVQEASKWARLNNDSLKDIPELKEQTTDFSSYIKTRAIGFLKSNDGITFNSDNFYSHILHNDNLSSDSRNKIETLKVSFKGHFTEKGIEGQVFVSRPNSITPAISKTKKKTQEGVIIEWQGDAMDKGILINNTNNQTVITITTSNLETIEK